MTRAQANLLLLACAAIWGFGFLFQKSAMAHIGPLLFIGARCLLAAAVLVPFAIAEHRRSSVAIERRHFVMSGLAAAAFLTGATLQQMGLKTASVMNTGFLTALYVVATPFISFALMRRPIAPIVWVGVILSFAGTWLLGGGSLGGFGTGDMLIAVCSLFWALQVVLVGIAAPLGRPMLFTTMQFMGVGIVALLGALQLEPVSIAGLQAAAVDIVFVGILASALTFTALSYALRSTTPAEASILISTEVLFAAFGAWVVLGETLTPAASLGAIAIVAASLIVQWPGRSKRT